MDNNAICAMGGEFPAIQQVYSKAYGEY